MQRTVWKDMQPYPFEALAKGKGAFALDTETMGKTRDTNIVTYYGWYSSDMGSGGGSTLTKDGATFFKALCASNRPKILHNLKRDLTFCENTGVHLEGPYHDTILAHVLLDEYHPSHSLEALSAEILQADRSASKELERQRNLYPKEYQNLYVTQEAIHADSVQDTKNTYTLFMKFLAQLKELGLLELYQNEVAVELVYWEITRRGQLVNIRRIHEVIDELNAPIKYLESQLFSLWGQFNPGSSKQLLKILTEVAGLALTKRNDPTEAAEERGEEEGSLSTNSKALREFRHIPGIPALLGWKRLTQASRMLVGYAKRVDSYGRLHTEYNQLTNTGRAASSNPNLMNIPKGATKITEIEVGDLDLGDVKLAKYCAEHMKIIRDVFIASPDTWLVAMDYSQGEYRILVDHTESERLIALFLDPTKDLHEILARATWGTYDDERRVIVKCINFGVPYGMSRTGIVENLKAYVGLEQAKGAYAAYENAVPEVFEFLSTCISDSCLRGYVRDRFGRYYRMDPLGRRYVFISHLCQGSLANVKKHALVKIHKIWTGSRSSIHEKHESKSGVQLDIHDDITCEVYPEDADKLFQVHAAMLDFPMYKLPFHVDISVGKDLGHMKKFKTIQEAVIYVKSNGQT